MNRLKFRIPNVIPAKAGIQAASVNGKLDSGFRGNDDKNA